MKLVKCNKRNVVFYMKKYEKTNNSTKQNENM